MGALRDLVLGALSSGAWYVVLPPVIAGETVVFPEGAGNFRVFGDPAGTAIDMGGSAGPLFAGSANTNLTFERLRVSNGKGYAFDLAQPVGCAVRSCKAVAMGGLVRMTSAWSSWISDCSAIGSTDTAIHLEAGSRSKRQHGQCVIEGTLVRSGGSALQGAERAGMLLLGNGIDVILCDLEDLPWAGIMTVGPWEFDTQSVMNLRIDLCNFSSICQLASDCGAAYFGRDPSSDGNTVTRSSFAHVRGKGQTPAVYADDLARGVKVRDNSFTDCNIAFQIGGGRENEFTGNKLSKVDLGVLMDDRGRLGPGFEWFGKAPTGRDFLIRDRIKAARLAWGAGSLPWADETDWFLPKGVAITGNARSHDCGWKDYSSAFAGASVIQGSNTVYDSLRAAPGAAS